MRHRLGQLVSAVVFVLGALGLYNVLADASGVDAQAQASTPLCQAGCTPTRFSRTPLWHDYTLTNRSGATVEVRCTRAWVLLGEHRCGPR